MEKSYFSLGICTLFTFSFGYTRTSLILNSKKELLINWLLFIKASNFIINRLFIHLVHRFLNLYYYLFWVMGFQKPLNTKIVLLRILLRCTSYLRLFVKDKTFRDWKADIPRRLRHVLVH